MTASEAGQISGQFTLAEVDEQLAAQRLAVDGTLRPLQHEIATGRRAGPGFRQEANRRPARKRAATQR